MKEIPLTKGKFVKVDDDDYEELSRYKWYCGIDGYARRQERLNNGKQKTILMHRVILNCDAVHEVDHIDGNRLNNQTKNLRLATSDQNRKNLKLSKRNTTGRKGVTFCNGVFKAQIQCDGRKRVIGYFKTLEDASVAYQKASQILFGKFARNPKNYEPAH